jgi:hypothetical protein
VCSSRQQWRRECGSKQHACVRQLAAVAGGTITMDVRQPACMQQRAADAACVQQHAGAAACIRQHAAAAACVQQGAGVAGSMIAMGDSDGSGQPAAQLQWAGAVAAQRMAGRRQDHDGQRRWRWATVG